jgi:transposase
MANPIGRPTDCTPEVTRRICEALRAGCTRDAAAAAGLVSRAAMARWIVKGNEGIDPYREFVEQVQRAEDEAEQLLLLAIQAQAPQDWKAAAWILERRRPNHWGRTQRHELTGADGGPVQLAAQVVEIPAQVPDAAAWAAIAAAGVAGVAGGDDNAAGE